MKIAGLQKLSLVDYPNYLAAVVFVQGCNFNCGFCYNPDLITQEEKFDFKEQDFFDFIRDRKNMLEAVVVTGGEPTIYNDLSEFIKRIKELDVKIKLDTNGSNPETVKSLLGKDLLDYIAMDIKTSFEKYNLFTDNKQVEQDLTECVKIIMNSDIDYEFRTTCVPGIVDKSDLRAIGPKIRGAKKYCLQQFKAINTYDESFKSVKPYTKETLQEFKVILEEFVRNVEIRGV